MRLHYTSRGQVPEGDNAERVIRRNRRERLSALVLIKACTLLFSGSVEKLYKCIFYLPMWRFLSGKFSLKQLFTVAITFSNTFFFCYCSA
jgi:hypothetical protein